LTEKNYKNIKSLVFWGIYPVYNGEVKAGGFEELIFVKNFRFTCASLENFWNKNQLRVQFQENTDSLAVL
jgi:hypothetical protein